MTAADGLLRVSAVNYGVTGGDVDNLGVNIPNSGRATGNIANPSDSAGGRATAPPAFTRLRTMRCANHASHCSAL
jgi:hypothetical protein